MSRNSNMCLCDALEARLQSAEKREQGRLVKSVLAEVGS